MIGYQAIVLAAGAGQRFGGGKLLATWRGRPLILAAVETALAAPVDDVVVVLGSDPDQVARTLAPVRGPRLQTVHAADWSEGIAASLRCGVASLPTASRGLLIFLGDMPAIPAGAPARVLKALVEGASAARPSHRGAPGHPVGMSSALYDELRVLRGDSGAGALVSNHPGSVLLEMDDAGSVFDIDRPEDLASL